jgi:uncharacterized protein YceK
MEITRSTKTFSFLLIICILISGCASTTLFTTEPVGATVYIKEKAKGTTLNTLRTIAGFGFYYSFGDVRD